MNELTMKPVDNFAVSSSVATKSNLSSKVATLNAVNVSKNLEAKKPEEKAEVSKLNANQMQEAVSRINEYVQQSERKLDFRMDEESGQTVIRVYDKQSDELIRQIPGDLALRLAQQLNDEEPSLLFRAQV